MTMVKRMCKLGDRKVGIVEENKRMDKKGIVTWCNTATVQFPLGNI
jgi:hypothetical protein